MIECFYLPGIRKLFWAVYKIVVKFDIKKKIKKKKI